MKTKLNRLSSETFYELVLLIIVAIFAIKPVVNFDFWFHLKYGEQIIAQKSLPFTDQYSHTALGQPAVPYEWLFQVVLYLIYSALGNFGVQVLVVILTITYVFLFRQILKQIFNLPLLPRLFLTSLNFILGYDFWVERPQIAAYALFMAVLYLLLKRVFTSPAKPQKYLWLTLPLFYIWANLHASMILGLYLFFGFAAVFLIKYSLTKHRSSLTTFKRLTAFGLINTLITLLPPLGTKVYQLLYLFWQKRGFILYAIHEWVPLTQLGIRFYLYIVIITLSLIALTTATLLNKQNRRQFWLFLPFIPLGLLVITGVRQTAFSLPVILLSSIPALKKIKFRLHSSIKTTLIITILVSTTFALHFYRQLVLSINRPYPVKAISFIKNNLKGNMYNELEIGGFLLYHLGPEIKTFIDGRTDMFLPTVFPQLDELTQPRYANDTLFLNYFNQLVKQYTVSWVILSDPSFSSVNHRLNLILAHEPNWALVYRDDLTVIYVKKDGLNDQVIKTFGI